MTTDHAAAESPQHNRGISISDSDPALPVGGVWLAPVRSGLLDVDPDLGLTRLAWLRRGATAATPEVLKAELDKLQFLRQHGADRLDLSRLPAGRRRMLAEIGRRSTNQALQRADVDRRHPVLLATLAETYVEVLDELVQLLDQALAGAESAFRSPTRPPTATPTGLTFVNQAAKQPDSFRC
jgi:hypothetical protein